MIRVELNPNVQKVFDLLKNELTEQGCAAWKQRWNESIQFNAAGLPVYFITAIGREYADPATKKLEEVFEHRLDWFTPKEHNATVFAFPDKLACAFREITTRHSGVIVYQIKDDIVYRYTYFFDHRIATVQQLYRVKMDAETGDMLHAELFSSDHVYREFELMDRVVIRNVMSEVFLNKIYELNFEWDHDIFVVARGT